MNWINRFTARTGSAGAAAFFVALGALPAIPALAEAPISAQYQGQVIRFSHLSSSTGALAIGVNDPGFQALLRSTGSVLTWKPGERYILITTSEPTVVSFALGDRRYDVGPITLSAAIAPYQRGDEAFLPFDEVLRSLDLALRDDGAVKILQPQLAVLDVRQANNFVVLNAHGGASLHPRIVRQSASEVVYAFDGVGTTLAGTRQINVGGVRSVEIQNSGTVRDPTTIVTVELAAGATVGSIRNTGDRDITISFGGGAPPPQSVAQASPTPQAPPPPENGSAAGTAAANGSVLVTGVTAQPSTAGITVAIAVTGNAQFEWHRLRDPDNRLWIDVKAAQLQGPPIERNGQSPLVSLRVRQLDPATVRVALSLDGPKSVSITPSTSGLTVDIGTEDVADSARSGSGSIGSVVSSSEQVAAPVTPAPLDNYSTSQAGGSDLTNWKFGPRSSYVPTNPRLIVIDPGHGGSDRGTIHGGVAEADLTLDMAKRLRDILVARGWQVKLTHDSDVDVYSPNDSPRDELQARVNIANDAGARLFISIHVNAFINSGPYGTTYYVSKPDDTALARAVETHLESDGTKDDGIIQSHMYVTYHTKMPAVLIETAFLSNPSDYALLTSTAWREKVVEEMADGIAQYAQEYPAPNQPAQ